MTRRLACVTLVVADYNEAIAYYTSKLGFRLVEDTPLSAGKRWVRIAQEGSETSILLAKASNESQTQRIGDQTGGRVFLFLQTDDFRRDYDAMQASGVRFLEAPREEEYGTVVVFEDLYGNKWDLVEYTAQ